MFLLDCTIVTKVMELKHLLINWFLDVQAKREDELMTLIETKQTNKFPRPTEELVKGARHEPTDIDIQSMMYLSAD